MVLFSGVPLVLGFASGPIVYYLKARARPPARRSQGPGAAGAFPLDQSAAERPSRFLSQVVQKAELEPGVLYLVGTTLFALVRAARASGSVAAPAWGSNRRA